MNFLKLVDNTTVNMVCNLSPVTRANLLSIAMRSIITDSSAHDDLEKMSSSINHSLESVTDMFALYSLIIRLYMESSDLCFTENLIKAGFTNDFLEELPLVCVCKSINSFLSHHRKVEKLLSFQWRVDISFNYGDTGVLPTIIIKFLLSNDTNVIIELDIFHLHKLRFSVADILKNLNCLKTSVSLNKRLLNNVF